MVIRCPYLEELIKDRHGPLRVYRFDCHVDHRTKHRVTLREAPPICVRAFEDCGLYQREKAREDHTIDRYRD